MIALISHTSMEKALAPTPVLLPGKFHGRRSLGGYSPWSHEESDTTERLHALEKEMATHSTVLAWKISGTGEPGRLPSMGSHRDGQDWSHLAAAAAMLAKQCSKFSKSDFNSTWTMNFQMFKLDLEKAEEPEIILPTSTGSSKKRESRETSTFFFTDYDKSFDCVDHKKLWKIFKEMGIPDPLTCLLRYLYAGQKATVRSGHGTTDWSKSWKEYVKTVYCHPAYLTYMQSTSCEMLDWMKHKLESRLLREISVTSDMQMTPFLWQKMEKN